MKCVPATTVEGLLVAVAILISWTAVFASERPAQKQAHPLDPVIPWAESVQKQAERIQDYTATLVKRERIRDRLQEHQHLQIKVRHEPFSVYIKFIGPSSLAGREVLYVDGQNNGMLLAHDPRGLGQIVGTVSLAPDSAIAMRGQRYPLTMIGIKNLGLKLIEQAQWSRRIEAPCEVKWYRGAKVNGRTALCIQVAHPERKPELQFAMARVYIDDQLGLPIRYEGYTWPENAGGAPVLVEEYTYSCIELNVGLTDRDFDPKNPHYNFR